METAFRQLFFDACTNAIKWGPGLLIALVMLYGLYRLIHSIGLKIVGALEKPTTALMMQAQSMDKLTGSIQTFVGRDQSEHREIIILQKVILEKIDNLRHRPGGHSGPEGGDRDGRDEKRTI